ncbi:MAG: Uncharacterized protein CEN87_439 [Parcubacteria group bacterium Licking1014_1]|nr:MAG: Uncharacterized protein CEN87_439 [Parcubacteria group bacterium Licking1014_1]
MPKYSDLSKKIIFDLAVVGVITIAATSPFFLINIANFLIKNRKHFKREYDKHKIAKAFERLKRGRLIILSEKEGKFKIELTEKGKRKFEEIKFDDMAIKIPLKWDKKWRIIIFDIPEKQYKRARNALREKLQKIGFYQLQKSVWVNPYPCEKEIQFLCEFFDVNRFVNIITADKIYNDIILRKYFELL